MGIFDKFIEAMSLNPPDEEDDIFDDGGYDDYDEEPSVPKVKQRKKQRKNDSEDEPSSSKPNTKRTGKITQIRPSKASIEGMEICVIKPKSVDDTREITDTLLSNRPVVLDVEGLDIGEAQRIIDFAAGSCYAINGNLQKITNYIIIISPPSVDISGDLLDIVDSDSFQVTGLHMEF